MGVIWSFYIGILFIVLPISMVGKQALSKRVNECMIDIFVLSGEAVVFMGMKSLSLKLEVL